MDSPFLAVPSDCWICSNEVAFAIPDDHPVTPGHALVVARRLVPTWWEATAQEQAGILALVTQCKAILDARVPRPDGYNVGFNAGAASGQTVMHLHVHVIPRYAGDSPDPRGGVRHVLPWKGNHLIQGIPRLSAGGPDDPFLGHVGPLWRGASRVSLLSAFVRQSGLGVLRPLLETARAQEGFRLRIITGDYLGITQPEALEQLRGWEALYDGQVEVRVVETECLPLGSRSFHPKSWIFESPGGGTAFVGSSNISKSALDGGIEWNLRLDQRDDGPGWTGILAAFEGWWARAQQLTPEWLVTYRARAAEGPHAPPEVRSDPSVVLPEPNKLQAEALRALVESRRAGHGRGLVVMATGLGKTLVAALDVVALAKGFGRMPRVLILAHREELLDQAALTFQRAFWEAGFRPRLSWFAGPQGDLEGDLVFAMVQKLGRREHVEGIHLKSFDYVFVDEAHHSEANGYRRILDRVDPTYLLGVTATPDRADGADLTGLFDDHVPFRADLGLGIEEGLLAPFSYVGLKDDIDYRNIPWKNRRFDPEELGKAAATQNRMEKLWEGWQVHPGTRTLVFCCSLEHARFATDWLKRRGVRIAAVHSGPDSANRSTALEDLRTGRLDALCAVDLFNEGVDLPAVDRVVMLRPTESPVLFLQQLGRGLRRCAGKEQVRVIDFVGNHRVFLDRLRVLLAAVDRRPNSIRTWLGGEDCKLPAGCQVDVQMEAKALMLALLPSRTDAGPVGGRLIEDIFNEQLAARQERPTAGELYRLGYDIDALRPQEAWFHFLARKHTLNPTAQALLEQVGPWLLEVQTTSMAKSFKMVTLEVLLEAGALTTAMALEELAERSRHFLLRSPDFLKDLVGVKAIPDPWKVEPEKWLDYWMTNPIFHWTNKGDLSWFRVESGNFMSRIPCLAEHTSTLHAMTRELVDYRLAKYRERCREPQAGDLEFDCKVFWNQRNPILKLPTADMRPRDTVQARLPGGEQWHFKLMAAACNVAFPVGTPGNRLPELLRDWFGPHAGKPGTRFRVRFSRSATGWRVRPLGSLALSADGLEEAAGE